jgi:hypothetical protein
MNVKLQFERNIADSACGRPVVWFVAIQKPHFGVHTPERAAVVRADLQQAGRARQLLSVFFLTAGVT